MTPPRGWTAPGCAGGTWLDVDPVARIAAGLYTNPTGYAADMRWADRVRAEHATWSEALMAHARQVGQAVTQDLNDWLHATGQLPEGWELALDLEQPGLARQAQDQDPGEGERR